MIIIIIYVLTVCTVFIARSFLLAVFDVLYSACVWAQTQYAPFIEDIEQRLDKTAELYGPFPREMHEECNVN